MRLPPGVAGLHRPTQAGDEAEHDRQPETGPDLPHPAVPLVEGGRLERHARSASSRPGPPSRTSSSAVTRPSAAFTTAAPARSAAPRGHPQGVLEQPVEHLPHPGCVGPDGDRTAGASKAKRTPSAAHRRAHIRGRRLAERHAGRALGVDAQVQRLQPREVQQVTDEALEAAPLSRSTAPTSALSDGSTTPSARDSAYP